MAAKKAAKKNGAKRAAKKSGAKSSTGTRNLIWTVSRLDLATAAQAAKIKKMLLADIAKAFGTLKAQGATGKGGCTVTVVENVKKGTKSKTIKCTAEATVM